MFKRLWLIIRSWFGDESSKDDLSRLEDPEHLLTQARREMASVHIKNRERAVEAITKKNNLQKMLQQREERLKQTEHAAAEAEGKPDLEAARNLRREAEEWRRKLTEARRSLEDAMATAEEVKRSIRDEGMRIRRRAAEKMAEKAVHRNEEIESEMRRKLEALNLLNHRQQSPTPERSAREILIALALCLLLVFATAAIGAWVRTR